MTYRVFYIIWYNSIIQHTNTYRKARNVIRFSPKIYSSLKTLPMIQGLGKT